MRVIDCRDVTEVPPQVFDAAEPHLLSGLVNHWPVVKQAEQSSDALLGYLQQYATDNPVTVFEVPASEKGRVFYNADLSGFNFSRGKAPLSAIGDELLKRNATDDALYVGSTLVDHWLPGFRDQNDLDLGGRDALISLWLGSRTRIAAHYDFPNNIACNIGGRRRFTLFPPEQAKHLYVGPLDFTPAGQAISMVDFAKPDLQAHPKFAEAKKVAQSVELEPGDAIYIPSMWWHHVESLQSVNALINYWWRPTPVYHGSPNNALLHAIMAIRDLPEHQRQIWKRMFDEYVFNAGEFEHIPESARGVLKQIDEETARTLRNLLLKFMK